MITVFSERRRRRRSLESSNSCFQSSVRNKAFLVLGLDATYETDLKRRNLRRHCFGNNFSKTSILTIFGFNEQVSHHVLEWDKLSCSKSFIMRHRRINVRYFKILIWSWNWELLRQYSVRRCTVSMSVACSCICYRILRMHFLRRHEQKSLIHFWKHWNLRSNY